MVEWKTCAKVISWVDLGTTGSEKCVASGGWRAKCRKLRENNIFIYGAQMRVSRRERVCVCVCSSLNKYLYTSCPPSSDENLRARQVCWPRGCNRYRKIVRRRHRFLFSAGSIERLVRARSFISPFGPVTFFPSGRAARYYYARLFPLLVRRCRRLNIIDK